MNTLVVRSITLIHCLCLALAVAGAMMWSLAPACAQETSFYTQGVWTVGPTDKCRDHYYQWTVEGDVARFADERGRISVERVTEWLPTGFRSMTIASSGDPKGTRWEYRVLNQATVRVTNATLGRTFILNLCPQAPED